MAPRIVFGGFAVISFLFFAFCAESWVRVVGGFVSFVVVVICALPLAEKLTSRNMARLIIFFALTLAVTGDASATSFNLAPTTPKVTEAPQSVPVGNCEVFSYFHDHTRYVYVRAVGEDGVVDTFRYRGWLNHKGERRNTSARLWWNTPNPTDGPKLIATCPLYQYPGLPQEVRDLGAADPAGE
jgi:hypothetical protein